MEELDEYLPPRQGVLCALVTTFRILWAWCFGTRHLEAE